MKHKNMNWYDAKINDLVHVISFMAFTSLSGNILESKESVIVKMFFVPTEAGLDCKVYGF